MSSRAETPEKLNCNKTLLLFSSSSCAHGVPRGIPQNYYGVFSSSFPRHPSLPFPVTFPRSCPSAGPRDRDEFQRAQMHPKSASRAATRYWRKVYGVSVNCCFCRQLLPNYSTLVNAPAVHVGSDRDVTRFESRSDGDGKQVPREIEYYVLCSPCFISRNENIAQINCDRTCRRLPALANCPRFVASRSRGRKETGEKENLFECGPTSAHPRNTYLAYARFTHARTCLRYCNAGFLFHLFTQNTGSH